MTPRRLGGVVLALGVLAAAKTLRKATDNGLFNDRLHHAAT